MRIVIDLQGAQTESRFRGIGRYSLSVTEAILRNKKEHEIIILLNGMLDDVIDEIRSYFLGLIKQENIIVWNSPGPVCEIDKENTWRYQLASLLREAFIEKLNPDILYITSSIEGYSDNAVTDIVLTNIKVPVVASLYDLIPLANEEKYLNHDKGYKKFYLEKSAQLSQADLLFSISEFSRSEAINLLRVPENKVVNVYGGVEPYFAKLNVEDQSLLETLKKYNLRRHFILYTGGADKRKNLFRLLQAFARLDLTIREKYQLVLAGKIGNNELDALKAEVSRLKINRSSVVFIGYVSNQEMVHLYNLCSLFVFPSWHEGLGLPAIEAMACGAAVIGANRSSLPEIINNEEALFDPYDVAEIKNKIEEVVFNESIKNSLISNGDKNVGRFTWDATGKRIINELESLHNNSVLNKKCRGKQISNEYIINRAIEIAPELISEKDKLELAEAVAKLDFPSEVVNVFIDVSELVLVDAKTGIQRVVKSILKNLIFTPRKNVKFIAVYGNTHEVGYKYAGISSGGQGEYRVGEVIDYYPGDVFLGLDYQPEVVSFQKPFLDKMKKEGVYIGFVVYDLLPVLMPHNFPLDMASKHEKWLSTIAKYCYSLCISEAVKKDFSQWLVKSKEYSQEKMCRVVSFKLGSDFKLIPEKSVTKDKAIPRLAEGNQSKKIIFLSVGTFEPRKNQLQILSAFEYLWENNINADLVFVGREGWNAGETIFKVNHHKQLNNKLHWHSDADDYLLASIYNSADCLVTASSGEGFGLPLIEASQYNLPIIARDIPSYREVAGDNAFYFQGYEPRDLADKIIEWITLYEAGMQPDSKKIKCITWDESAEDMLDKIYNVTDHNEFSPPYDQM